MGDVAVIVPAGGSSVRFGGEKNKLVMELGGKRVLSRAIEAFRGRSDVEMIVVAGEIGRGEADQAGEIGRGARVAVCKGGECRAESVWNGLKAIPEEVEWVAVHDGARPLVSQGLIDRVIAGARRYGAAVPAMAVAVTVKEAEGGLPARVVRTVPRAGLWGMQTPQVMRRADLMEAFEKCPIPLEKVTDDVQLLELVGKEVWLVEGEERNLKITTGGDLRVAEMWLGTEKRG